MPRSRRSRAMLFVVLLAIAAAVVPPLFRINRYQHELESSLSRALGRNVAFQGDIRFRLLPQPAIIGENFIIADDPAFGIEPMLRAETVTARLRLSSLWRGRLEIAQLNLDFPSWNLVRNAQGRWNVESLLQRTSQVQTAPTARKQPQTALRFPYIETATGRINFKLEHTKLAYALLETDFALWQESEDRWQLRWEGRLTRTDQNLRDTGILRGEGSFIRSHGEPLEQTPFDLRFELEDGQLGQLTSLFTGHDHGWRANVNANATLEGSLENLKLASDVEIRDFRRYDLVSSDFMKTNVHCGALISKRAPYRFRAESIECTLPIGEGKVAMSGSFAINGAVQYRLRVTANEVPVQPLVSIYRRAKAGVPEDLRGSGLLSGTFDFDRAEQEHSVATAFSGEIAGLMLGAKSLDTDFEIGKVRFSSVASPLTLAGKGANRKEQITQNWLVFDPVMLDLGGRRPVAVMPRVSGQGFVANVRGEAALARLLAASKTFGFAQRDYNAQGSAMLDVTIESRWAGLQPPMTTGTAQLRNVSLVSDGIASPLRLSSAAVSLSPELVTVDRISGSWEGTRTQFEGMVRMPRTCPKAECQTTFDLRATELSTDEINRQLNPRFRRTDWLALPRRLIGKDDENESVLFSIQANGRIEVDRFTLKSLAATRLTANIRLHQGLLEATEVRAEVLGGRHTGDWTADFSQAQPAFSGTGYFDRVQLPQTDSSLLDNWNIGSLDGRYRLQLTGSTPAALASSAHGTIDYTWKNGVFRRLVSRGDAFAFTSWTGRAEVTKGEVRLVEGRMVTANGLLVSSGTIGLDRQLNLRLQGASQEVRISGSLEDPILEIQRTQEGTIASRSASNPANASPTQSPR